MGIDNSGLSVEPMLELLNPVVCEGWEIQVHQFVQELGEEFVLDRTHLGTAVEIPQWSCRASSSILMGALCQA